MILFLRSDSGFRFEFQPVVIGGIVSSTLLTLVVLPVLCLLGKREVGSGAPCGTGSKLRGDFN